MDGIIEKASSQNSSFYSRYLICEAKHFMLKARKKELSQYHITPEQIQIIIIIYTLHKTTLAELSKLTNREINSLSNQMSKMERDGLVKKTRETPKSNLLSFELTEKGYSFYAYGKDRVTEEIMSVLSEEERQQLISMLRNIIDKAKKYKN